jgi:aspartate-semialdehyde dehydrogenase
MDVNKVPGRIPVGVLGATGTVGQRFIQLLDDHPWFRVTALAASDRSAGKRYVDACHWLLPTPIPGAVRELVVHSLGEDLDCPVVFSALPSRVAGPVEVRFARAGHIVCSNASAHRMDADVPLLVPEVNPDHVALIDLQRRQRGWKGAIVTSANCSTTQLVLALKPLHDAFGLRKLSIVTMQAVSGAGYPGVASLDILGNVVPYISGEEEKMESETCKMLGRLESTCVEDGAIAEAPITVSAQCNRVPVRDGHLECLSIEFGRPGAEHKPGMEQIIATLESFRAPSEAADLPSTPAQPIVVRREVDRPQPLLDRETGRGTSVTVGRIRACPVLDCKFVLLGHNTLRGAAGGSIHNAELLVSRDDAAMLRG